MSVQSGWQLGSLSVAEACDRYLAVTGYGFELAELREASLRRTAR